MSIRVDRTCREVRQTASHDGRVALGEPKPLSEYRDKSAYVLLGDPGAGKTTEFKSEQEALGDEAALFVSARNFRTLAEASRAEWGNKTLFIDGLDETRAGANDARTPLDDIRTQLARLDKPRFRLSCREADWLGSNDQQHLQDAYTDSEIIVLRLDPLDADGVGELLRSEHQMMDVKEFVQSAHRYGVGALLGNPLTLDLLARVVQGVGEWPRSRQETLERACRLLASEHNEEHRFGRGVVPRDTVMDAAGYLCALLLLAGMDAYSVSAHNLGPSLVRLHDLSDPPEWLARGELEHALSTKLFTAAGMAVAEGTFGPLHRHVAEFLAGRFLAKQVEGGLPARRVVALMTGPADGRVVTALRGLSAWLAAHSSEARLDLIAADPVGVGLYGDIGGFSHEERRRLLKALPASLVHDDLRRGDTALALRSLASADLVPAIQEMLGRVRTGSRNDPLAGVDDRGGASVTGRAGKRIADDRPAALILGVLRHAEIPCAVAALAPDLMAIVRDDAVPSYLRTRALDAWVRITVDSRERAETLEGLLAGIHAGSVSDPDDDLRGILLKELYPDVVGPSDVWRHIVVRSQGDYFGRLWAFADKVLLERAREQHLAELLDALHEHAAELVPALMESRLGDLPLRVLKGALSVHGENVEPARLAGWLAVANRSLSFGDRRSSTGVRAWLESRPQIQKAVYLESLRSPGPDDDAETHPFWHFRHSEVLHGSRLPPEFGRWCLDQAVALEDAEQAVSLVLLSHAHAAREDPSLSEGLTVETMRERVRGRSVLERRLDELLQPRRDPPPSAEHRTEIEEQRRRRDEERRRQREGWAAALREQHVELRENRGPPPMLHSLALTYLGMFDDDDRYALPVQRVGDRIDGDSRLVAAAIAALRGAVLRDDVPSVDETISLHSQSRHSWMAYPVLASLHLFDFDNPAQLDKLDDTRKRDVLAIYYCVAEHDDYGQHWHGRVSQDPLEALDRPHRPREPHWYVRWLQQDPDLVLDVLRKCALAGVRAGQRFPPGMDALDAVAGHEVLVHGVRLELLKAFPTRSSNEQLALLDSLLTEALDYPDKTELLALAQHKQALRSVPAAQRVRWWATDALISQGDRVRQLKTRLVESETRVRHLAQFLRSVWDRYDRRRSILADITDPAALKEVIKMLGSWCAPAIYPAGGFVYTLEMDTSELIQQLVEQLGSAVGDEAEQALESLIEDPQLARWHDLLARARERQRVVQRDASYRHPSVEEVQSTLDNKAPANAADLAALLAGELRSLSDRVRTDPSNIWSQFWNADSHGRPTDPRHENLCRDALLAALRVPVEVGLDPEASHASAWKSDLLARCRDFSVPIEIKRDRHRDLWRAMRSQLIGQYTASPATSGYGIYLVLWFGDGKVQTPPGGNRPRTPEELEQRLRQDLSPDERRKISVVVMDVSKPGRPEGAELPLAETGVRS